MTPYEIIYLTTCVINIIVAIVSLIIAISAKTQANENSQKTLDKAEIQNLIALGAIEIAMNERISQTRQKISDISISIAPLLTKSTKTPDEERTLEIYVKALNSEIENNLNAYEEVCMKYLDKKIDVVRFKKTYYTEIRQLVEHEKYKKYFDGVTSKYKAILKVYDEWNNLEK